MAAAATFRAFLVAFFDGGKCVLRNVYDYFAEKFFVNQDAAAVFGNFDADDDVCAAEFRRKKIHDVF